MSYNFRILENSKIILSCPGEFLSERISWIANVSMMFRDCRKRIMVVTTVPGKKPVANLYSKIFMVSSKPILESFEQMHSKFPHMASEILWSNMQW